jgi:haloalkane dehalogenase
MAEQHGQEHAQSERPAWVDPTLFPFQSHFTHIDGCRIHYVDEGNGPILLLLHGNPTWSFLYRGIMEQLQAHFRCIALDYPGFGLSQARSGYTYTPAEHAAIVEQFIMAHDLTDITVMVQDWGGPIGLGVATRHPERFRALVIGNTWAWPVNDDPHFRTFSRFLGGSVGRWLIKHVNLFVNVLIPAGIRRHRVSRRVMQQYRRPFPTRTARLPTHIFPREILGSRAYLAEVEANLARLAEHPALIVWGDADMAFRAKEREQFEQRFRQHHTVILRGAGHYIQEDAPTEIAYHIQQWWQ